MTPDDHIKQAIKMVSQIRIKPGRPQILCAIHGQLRFVPCYKHPPKRLRVCSSKNHHGKRGFPPQYWIGVTEKIQRLHEKGLLL